ncbi:MAG: nucleotidyltransferase family protein [Cyanobacteriota bacterium]
MDFELEAEIPGIPAESQQRLLRVLAAQPNLEAVWLFGSRAFGRHRSGSDIDLCLDGPGLSHRDRLRLMAALEELLLPWQVDLVLRQELPADLQAHLQRVGRCLWKRPSLQAPPQG